MGRLLALVPFGPSGPFRPWVMANERGERLLAVTGITAALRPGPIRLTLGLAEKADRLSGVVRRDLRKFIQGTRWEKAAPLPDFDYEELLELLAPEPTEQRLAEETLGWPDQQLADEYMQALGRAWAYLRALLPLKTRRTLTEERNVRPNDFTLSRFRRAFWVVNDPLIVFRDLREGCLVADQVRTLERVYPATYALAKEEAFRLVALTKARKPTWELPYDRERRLRTFLQDLRLDAAQRKRLQGTFEKARAEQEQKNQASGGGVKGRFSEAATTSQKLEAGGAG